MFTGIVICQSNSNDAEIMQLISPHAEHLRLKPGELQLLSRGEIVARDLPASHSKEMSAFGAMLVDAEPKEFIEAFRTLSVFKKSRSIIACGRFGEHPELDDLLRLSLKDKDYLELMHARVRASDVKLSAADMARIQTIAGPGSRFSSKLTAALLNEYKEILLEKVRSYSTLGGKSLGANADQDELVDTNEAMLRMLRYQASYAKYSDKFYSLLADPHNTDEQAESFYYWAVQKFGQLKPVIILVHVTIFHEGERVFIASEQIYSNHYTEAGLGIAELIPFTDQDGKVRTLFGYTVRLQVDMFGGTMGFLKKKMAHPRMLETMKESLHGLRANLEAAKNTPQKAQN
ncbi:MAG: hypothetical protein J2P41_06385 [Blastocatellia bacterium]|nr:hypothetical protein [Blastocatellia bacterium]